MGRRLVDGPVINRRMDAQDRRVQRDARARAAKKAATTPVARESHTPGPWTLGKNGDDCAPGHAICAGPYVIAKVYGGGFPVKDGGTGWSPRTQADAHLIVTAPDLLQLVREAREALQPGVPTHHVLDVRDWLKAADAAIAKAEGRS